MSTNDSRAGRPPRTPAPQGAKQVLVTLRLVARDANGFRAHLSQVIPVTRTASGCRYSHTYQDPASPEKFALVQGWDSLEQQQAYLAWRESTGDLAAFGAQLAQPPAVDVYELVDA